MRLAKRIGLLIRAKIGRRRSSQDRAETVLRRADKTEALLEQIEERLKRASARQIQLQNQLRQAQEMALQWDSRADKALRAGDNDAAREAIRHKLAYTQVAAQLQGSLARQTAAAQELETDVNKLESRLKGIQSQKSKTPRPSSEQPAQETFGKETLEGVESLRERMNRVWSDQEIDKELDAIKSRLSAGMRE